MATKVKTGLKSLRKPKQRKIKVGDRIAMPLLGNDVFAVVVEDRGYIGMNGRRLLRIRRRFDEENESVYEVPEEEVELAPASK